MSLLKIENLHATVETTEILHGLNLEVNPGEVHAIMGPNGSGKSTLTRVIAGSEDYEVTGGSIEYEGEDLLELGADERAQKGVFMAFQYPVEIPGVSNTYFLKAALNSIRKSRGEKELDAIDFLKLIREKSKLLELDEAMLKRGVNVGFSGGEKKRNEILQMAVLDPKLAVLDETDSGLDIDAMQVVADAVNKLRTKDRGIILVTHYQRLLNHIVPDVVHVMVDGKIVKSGDKDLALHLEEVGYAWVNGELKKAEEAEAAKA